MGKLKSPSGVDIIGTAETLTGVSLANVYARRPDGAYEAQYTGTTEVDWDGQKTARDERGVRLYVDENRNSWPEDQLIYVEDGEGSGDHD